MRKFVALAGSVGLMIVGVGASPAWGDPSAQGGVTTLTCGSDEFTIVTTPGNGRFTPGFDVASTGVFIPVAFGASTYTVLDALNHVLFTATDPGSTQKAGKRMGQRTLDCTYYGTFEGVDPDLGPIHGFSSGTVVIKTKAK